MTVGAAALASANGALAEVRYRVVELGAALEQAAYHSEFGMEQGRFAINDQGIVSGNAVDEAGNPFAMIWFPSADACGVTYPLRIPLTANGLSTTSCDLSEGIDPVVAGYVGVSHTSSESMAAAWRGAEGWTATLASEMRSAAFSIADDGRTIFGTCPWECGVSFSRRGTKWILLTDDAPLAIGSAQRLDSEQSKFSENAATTAELLSGASNLHAAGIGHSYRCTSPYLCHFEDFTQSMCFDAEWGLIFHGGEPYPIVPHGRWSRCGGGKLDTPRGVAVFARSLNLLYGHAQGGSLNPFGGPWPAGCDINSGNCDQCEDYATVWHSLGSVPIYLGHLPVASGWEHEASTVQGASRVADARANPADWVETAVGTLTESEQGSVSRRRAVRWQLSPVTGIWSGVALDELLEERGLNLTQAHGVNASGWIVATSAPNEWEPGFAFVLIPVADSCVGDIDGDGMVAAADLSVVLGNWGECVAAPCLGDLDCNGVVDASDLASLLGNWGPCP